MRYWHPYTEEALEQIRKDGVEALVILPLYPQFSISTSGSSLRVLQEVFSRDKKAAPPFHTVVPSWYDRPGYVQAVADLLQAELDQITDEEVASQKEESPQLAGKHILFSAHGVPASYIEAGDPYQEQMIKCVAAIGEEVQSRNPANTVEMHLSYQSRVGPVEWLRPYTDDVIPELGASGIRNLVVVPISFVSEHIETLEEIDMEYRELAEKSGITNWHRCPALNTHPGFVADLADLVHEALEEPTMTVTEACIANSVENLVMDESQSGVVGINTAGVQNVLGAEGEFGSFLL
jgi:ferrochelatase